MDTGWLSGLALGQNGRVTIPNCMVKTSAWIWSARLPVCCSSL